MRSKISVVIAILLSGLLSGQQICFAYKSVIPYNGVFAAVGEPGRIDFYSPEGALSSSVELPSGMEVNDVCVYDGALVGTANGAIVTYRNGELGFQPLKGEASALIPFKGKLMVAVNGSDGVRMLCYEGLGTLVDELLLPVEGRMTALTASENYCFGVTSEGEILRSGDGIEWLMQEFNADYEGYYPPMEFIDVEAGMDNVAIVGRTRNGGSAMFLSSYGIVWSPRELSYSGTSGNYMLEEEPLSIIYDPLADQYVLLCTSGVLFYVPACAHCNKREQIKANELYSLAFTPQGELFVVGSDSFAAVVSR